MLLTQLTQESNNHHHQLDRRGSPKTQLRHPTLLANGVGIDPLLHPLLHLLPPEMSLHQQLLVNIMILKVCRCLSREHMTREPKSNKNKRSNTSNPSSKEQIKRWIECALTISRSWPSCAISWRCSHSRPQEIISTATSKWNTLTLLTKLVQS